MRRSCVIVDDNLNCIKDLSYAIEEIAMLDIERTFDNPDFFLAKLDVIDSDIIFLDIEMPISGIQVAEKIKDKSVIFVSGTNKVQNVLDAFKKVKSRHFLTKPVRISELKETIEEILSNIEGSMIVKSEKFSKHKIYFNNVAFIETVPNNNNYKSIHFIEQSDNNLVVNERDSMASWSQKHRIPSNFLKIGASTLINMDAIIALNGRSGSKTPELIIAFSDGSTSNRFSISSQQELSTLLDYKPEFKGKL